MSTPCIIAVKDGDKYTSIYCHWDGYRAYMWPMLTKHYGSFEKAKELISYGDASSISVNIEPLSPESHDFYTPENHVCVFYNRDRHDEWIGCAPQSWPTKEALLGLPHAEQHVYIYEDGGWSYYYEGELADRELMEVH